MPSILVHGGAGEHLAGCPGSVKIAGVRRSADAGWVVLERGGSAVDAVEASTRVLEDDPCFDAGCGSYLNRDGEVELDAILMDGCDLKFGAVAGVKGVKNAVTLARRVMEATPHAFVVGRGAERLAAEWGLTVPPESMITPEMLAEWRRQAAEDAARRNVPGLVTAADILRMQSRLPTFGDTVGAVAVDAAGRVAAATSTGGTHHKLAGRVGDSPIVGAGAYADNRSGGVSCTGHGESIMRICMAFVACQAMGAGADAMAAANEAVLRLTERTGGPGGCIAVDREGRLGWAWNTRAMPYGWRTEGGQGEGM